ncbi:GntR family transcriptional regulator, partial [Streptococcus hyovaginalis]
MSTKYKKIVEEIKNQLTNGTLVAGSKLPSVRQLSETFSCSKNTVIKAYSELEKEHLVYAIPQSGYYIVNEFALSAEDSTIVDFLSAGPDNHLIPYLEFQHCLNQAIEIYKKDILPYSHHKGFSSFRKDKFQNLHNSQIFHDPIPFSFNQSHPP